MKQDVGGTEKISVFPLEGKFNQARLKNFSRRKESKFVTNVIDWTNRTGWKIGFYCLAFKLDLDL